MDFLHQRYLSIDPIAIDLIFFSIQFHILTYTIKLTILYPHSLCFEISQNPWDVIHFSGNSKIHLDTFTSIFNISGLPDELYHNGRILKKEIRISSP